MFNIHIIHIVILFENRSKNKSGAYILRVILHITEVNKTLDFSVDSTAPEQQRNNNLTSEFIAT